MKKFLTVVIITLAATTAEAQTIEQMVADKSDAEVIQLWITYEKRCQADLSGEINVDCLARTDLGDVLRKRGFCERVVGVPEGRWVRCLVQS